MNRNMPKTCKLLALVALAGALAYGREVLVVAQFVGGALELIMGVL